MTSRDGYHWTPETGLKAGVPSIGVIQPPSNISSKTHFDVIVAGAGYTGLTAARNAASSGLNVLLLEARDRIGGRSWSSNIGGYPFEMGGTWVHWGQPHVYREISRYDMRKQLEISLDQSRGINHFSLVTPGGTRTMGHSEEDALVESGMLKFVNVDNNIGKSVIPFPHDPHFSPLTKKYTNISAATRISQIEDLLSPAERACLEAFLLLCSGGTLETTSFFEFLHWWALCGYSNDGLTTYLMTYKFKCGQSGFAINFFREALATKKLSYAFNSPIATIKDENTMSGVVEVTCTNGQSFTAARLICTIPLNVLPSISFSPPLPASKATAISIPHVNQCTKVHAELRDRDLRSWMGVTYPHNKLLIGFGDGETPVGNTHCVFFGAQQGKLHPEENIANTVAVLDMFKPGMLDGKNGVERLVFHNWSKDPYAKGAWYYPHPSGDSEEILEALRSRHGAILFASADWALGWRGFIDGAIEEGARAALVVQMELLAARESEMKEDKGEEERARL